MEAAQWMSFPRVSDSATCGGFWNVLLYVVKPYRDNIIKGSASNQFIVYISRSFPGCFNWTGFQLYKGCGNSYSLCPWCLWPYLYPDVQGALLFFVINHNNNVTNINCIASKSPGNDAFTHLAGHTFKKKLKNEITTVLLLLHIWWL